MVLVFDLDDTLYDEQTYVRSGFRSVAKFLWSTYRIPIEGSYLVMNAKLAEGRDKVFDQLLMYYNIYSKKLVRECLSVYRKHQPDIRLYSAASDCLERFKDIHQYIVTDGNKLVQANKLKALGLPEKMKNCFITRRYGIKNEKPSPYCFLKICELEKVRPHEVVYIADNPHKDFVGIKPLGFKTVRVRQGAYRDVQLSAEYEADWQIKSLDELTEKFLEAVFK